MEEWLINPDDRIRKLVQEEIRSAYIRPRLEKIFRSRHGTHKSSLDVFRVITEELYRQNPPKGLTWKDAIEVIHRDLNRTMTKRTLYMVLTRNVLIHDIVIHQGRMRLPADIVLEMIRLRREREKRCEVA